MNVGTRRSLCVALAVVLISAGSALALNGSIRSEAHAKYAVELWSFITKGPYTAWSVTDGAPDVGNGPTHGAGARTYWNALSNSNREEIPVGGVLVTEDYADDRLVAVTVRYRVKEGYSPTSGDWYWIQYTPSGAPLLSSVDRNAFAKPGFAVIENDGRLWVFRTGTAELLDFTEQGELAQHVIMPAAGPAGKTLRGPDRDTLMAYVVARDGFVTELVDGRLWVFRADSEELAAFRKDGELAKHVIRPAAGPQGLTLKAPDAETLAQFLAAKPGYATRYDDGRLWVFEVGSEELKAYDEGKESAQHVIRPGSGPDGMTLKAIDLETIDGYLAASEGFETVLEDGRIWVFLKGSAAFDEFKLHGEPAQHVIRPGAGPHGMTVKSPDAEVLDAYLRAIL